LPGRLREPVPGHPDRPRPSPPSQAR
jgi:hypothetical protein